MDDSLVQQISELSRLGVKVLKVIPPEAATESEYTFLAQYPQTEMGASDG